LLPAVQTSDQPPPSRPPRLFQLRLKARPLDVKFNVFVGQSLQFIKHAGDIPRYADLIGLSVVGLGQGFL
jgi:hypothetical protein